MWRLKTVGHKAAVKGISLEEYKLKRREHEKALRQARRDKQLVSKRLLLHDDDDEDDEDTMDSDSPQQVVEVFLRLQHSRGQEAELLLKDLSRTLRNPAAQLLFIKQENSIHLLIGHLTGHMAQCRLLACRCLHQLSQSLHPNTAPCCLEAAPYLITFLSGQSPKFTEVCLYTLGNMVPDGEAVRHKLLAQGLIPALDNCFQTHRHSLAVVEAVGFTLSQLLQTKDAAETIVPSVLTSGLPKQLLSVLTLDPQFGHAPAIEVAWCLHYLTCSASSSLLSLGALSACSSLLVALGGAVAAGNKEEGLELLLWPLLRCVGNLLCCGPQAPVVSLNGGPAAPRGPQGPVVSLNGGPMDPGAPTAPGAPGAPAEAPRMPLCEAVRLLAALCAFAQAFLHSQPALARESLWVLNNLTADSSPLVRAVLSLKLLPVLIRMLPFSEGINTMVLRVMCNVAHHHRDLLAGSDVLSALTVTLKMSDPHVVTLSLELLHMVLDARPQVCSEFVIGGGVPLLESIQFNTEEELRTRATFLLDKHLTPYCSQS